MAVKERYRLLYDGACPICRREALWLYRPLPVLAGDALYFARDATLTDMLPQPEMLR